LIASAIALHHADESIDTNSVSITEDNKLTKKIKK
jgi:hypothetical protein